MEALVAEAGTPAVVVEVVVLGVPVVRPRITETTALGAAYLAGLAVGYWPDRQTLARQWQEERRFRPVLKPARRKALVAGWDQALRRARAHG